MKSRKHKQHFKPILHAYLEKKSINEICKLVNSAALTILTYHLIKETHPNSHTILNWIENQRLNDGGWHWKPKHLKPKKSEAWCTALILATYKCIGRA